MYVDYLILAFVSFATFVYAYVRRPDGSASDDDRDGGIPKSGDSSPTDHPPSISVPDRDRTPSRPAVPA